MEKFELEVSESFYIGDISLVLKPELYKRWESNHYQDGIYKGFAVVETPIVDRLPANTGYYMHLAEYNIGIVTADALDEYADFSGGELIDDYSGIVTITKEDNGNIAVEWLDNIVRIYVTDIPDDLEMNPVKQEIEPYVDPETGDEAFVVYTYITPETLEKIVNPDEEDVSDDELLSRALKYGNHYNPEGIMLDNGCIITARAVDPEKN